MLNEVRSNQPYTTYGGWWPCEERAMLSMLEDGYNTKKIALVLSRTMNAVYHKYYEMREKGLVK